MKNPIELVKQKIKNRKKKSTFGFRFVGDDPDSRFGVVDALRSVNLNSPDAGKNAHSISDNNGGRIELDQDDQDVIKK